jgi:hypothetical protein
VCERERQRQGDREKFTVFPKLDFKISEIAEPANKRAMLLAVECSCSSFYMNMKN